MKNQNQTNYQTLTLPIATIIAVIVEQPKKLPTTDHPDKPGHATYLAILAKSTDQLSSNLPNHRHLRPASSYLPIYFLLTTFSSLRATGSAAYLEKQKAKEEATNQATAEPTQQTQQEPHDEQGNQNEQSQCNTQKL